MYFILYRYSYGVLRKTKTGTKWRCTQRNPSVELCGAMVNQLWDSFTRIAREHCDPPTTGKAVKVKAVRDMKQKAKENPYNRPTPLPRIFFLVIITLEYIRSCSKSGDKEFPG